MKPGYEPKDRRSYTPEDIARVNAEVTATMVKIAPLANAVFLSAQKRIPPLTPAEEKQAGRAARDFVKAFKAEYPEIVLSPPNAADAAAFDEEWIKGRSNDLALSMTLFWMDLGETNDVRVQKTQQLFNDVTASRESLAHIQQRFGLNDDEVRKVLKGFVAIAGQNPAPSAPAPKR